MKILIIEDEASLADIIAARLRQENFTTDICRNGDDVLYSALSGVYDLIILEVMLPGTGGVEILHELRKEFLLLEYFMSNPGQVLSREKIYDRV